MQQPTDLRITRHRRGAPVRALTVVVALAVLTTLSGCFGGTPSTPQGAGQSGDASAPPASTEPSVAPSASAVPTPTASATPTPTVDPNVLFTISTTAIAPNGSKVDFVQTVYLPVDKTTNMAADSAALTKQCGDWKTLYPTRKYVVAEVSSTHQAGTPAWPKDSAIGVDMNGYPAWSGDYSGFQALCATVIVTVGGHIHGVVPVPTANSADGKMGWARVEYGFAIASGDPDATAPKPGELRLTGCTISLSPTAKTTSVIAPKWATQAQKYPGETCRFGAGF